MAECIKDKPNLSVIKLKSGEKHEKIIVKYPVGGDVDKEVVFSFPYIKNKETVYYIKNYARVMFIIRGPPSTGKATLSEMITDKYPNAVYCCADRYFKTTFARVQRNKETLKASHTFCQKKVIQACKNDEQTIIIQNTHMRKWEMQPYLDIAALYHYTVIMAITLYRFDCTPQALAENNTDGLDIDYFRNRLRQWEDIMPLFTGWFISPNDSAHIHHYILKSLESLLDDGKFSRIFNIYNADDLNSFFKPRRLLCCLGGYMKDLNKMKEYYLSDKVQVCYGKCFSISLFGYLVTINGVIGIVNNSQDMNRLCLIQETKEVELDGMMNSLTLQTNLSNYSTSSSYLKNDELPQVTTLELENVDETEEVIASSCSFIDLARKDYNPFDIEALQKEFHSVLESMTDANGHIRTEGYIELGGEGEHKIYRLPYDVWFVKLSQRIYVKSIFTGLYV